jgi:bifunctional NMN adenylyltransferase/nudix hydrolase
MENKTLLKDVASLGVVVCRMQVPDLTRSHEMMLQSVLNRHERILVVLGVSDKDVLVEKNPFSLDFRTQMLNGHVRANDSIVGLKDNLDDGIWVNNLDNLIDTYLMPGEKVVLYGGRDSFVPYYKKHNGKYDTVELNPVENDSGTASREMARHKRPVYSPEVADALLWQASVFRQFYVPRWEVESRADVDY